MTTEATTTVDIGADAYSKLLKRLGACTDAFTWSQGKSLREAWEQCDRIDWMYWLAVRVGVDRKLIVLSACDHTELVLKYIPENEQRPRKCLEVTRKWCRGEATIEEVRQAREGTWQARNDAWNVYWDARNRVGRADAAAAAYAYAAAAYADAYADAAYAAARREMRTKCRDAVRQVITVEVLVSAINAME